MVPAHTSFSRFCPSFLHQGCLLKELRRGGGGGGVRSWRNCANIACWSGYRFILIRLFLWPDSSSLLSLPGSMACSGWQLSIELIIGSNLPNQVPKSLSSWKRFIPDDVLTFITASLQMLMHRLNFCLVCFTLKVNSSPLSWHLSFASSITFS